MKKWETDAYPIPAPPLIVRAYSDYTVTSEPVTSETSNFGEFVRLGKFL